MFDISSQMDAGVLAALQQQADTEGRSLASLLTAAGRQYLHRVQTGHRVAAGSGAKYGGLLARLNRQE